MRRLCFFVLLAAVPGAPAQLPPVSDPGAEAAPRKEESRRPRTVPLQNTIQAVKAALEDAQGLPPLERCFFRYLWVQDGAFKPANLVLNMISRGLVVIRAVPRDNGRLLRVDLRHYIQSEQDLEEMTQTWERLRYDPTFSLLVTEDNVRLVQQYFPDVKQPFTKKKVNGEWKRVPVPVARFNPDYLAPDQQRLQELLQTEAPIAHDKYFMHRATTTVKNFAKGKDSLWAKIWGGLYYEFRGIKRSDEKGVTDEDLWYQQFGITLPVEKFFSKLPSDQRTVVEESDVTGKMRRVDFFNTPAGKGWDIMGVGATTHDFNDADIDVG